MKTKYSAGVYHLGRIAFEAYEKAVREEQERCQQPGYPNDYAWIWASVASAVVARFLGVFAGVVLERVLPVALFLMCFSCTAEVKETWQDIYYTDCPESWEGLTVYRVNDICTYSCDDYDNRKPYAELGVTGSGAWRCEAYGGHCNEQRDCIQP